MKQYSFKNVIFIGITLFSMFFGAGNLIFSPYLGAQAGTSTPLALLGFICTAVITPVLAVVIISKYKDAIDMISGISKPFAVLFISLIYLLIGPCIAIPRTATTSMEMFGYLLPDTFGWHMVYILLFFGVCTLTALKPGKLKDVLGKIVGPILVVMVFCLCAGSFFLPKETAAASATYSGNAFISGFLDGYQTMDILAAFCFGIVILLNIDQVGVTDPKQRRSLLSKSAVVAGCLLALLYASLAYAAMIHAGDYQSFSNGALILSTMAEGEFGAFGQVLISLIFLAACYNVCSGLLSCCAEYFFNLTKKGSYLIWLLAFSISGAVVSIFGLDAILSASAPVLNWICPIGIILLIYGWVRSYLRDHRDKPKKPHTPHLKSGAQAE